MFVRPSPERAPSELTGVFHGDRQAALIEAIAILEKQKGQAQVPGEMKKT